MRSEVWEVGWGWGGGEGREEGKEEKRGVIGYCDVPTIVLNFISGLSKCYLSVKEVKQ